MEARADSRIRKELKGLSADSGRHAFSLVEVMVAAALSGILLTAVLATFIFLSRSGVRMVQYRDMEAQSRLTVQLFGQDTRQATDVSWTNANTLSLTLAAGTVTYSYNSSTRRLTRTAGGGSAITVASGLTSFQFRAYNLNGGEISLASPTSQTNKSTKMIQVDIDLSRSASWINTTSQIISARYVLRGKEIT